MVVAGQGRFNAATPEGMRQSCDRAPSRLRPAARPTLVQPVLACPGHDIRRMSHSTVFSISCCITLHHETLLSLFTTSQTGVERKGNRQHGPRRHSDIPVIRRERTTDARRSDSGRLSSTSFMLHYLPTPRERCDGCHFANY